MIRQFIPGVRCFIMLGSGGGYNRDSDRRNCGRGDGQGYGRAYSGYGDWDGGNGWGCGDEGLYPLILPQQQGAA